MNHTPLKGLRILDFCWVGAGSYTTKILADLGADVIKVESRRSLDSLRLSAPYKDGIKGINRSGYFADRNSSKRSITINLKHPQGPTIVYRLLKDIDVVTNNFTPGTMDRLGLDYSKLREINPALIFIGMSMNGDEGPERDMLGYGITMSALTGLMASSGLPDRPAVGTGTNFPDHIPNPCHAAFAILAAVRHQRRTGQGQLIDMAQTEPMLALLAPQLMDAAANAHDYIRNGNRIEGCAPRGVYPTQGEDRWIAISVRSDREWQGLVSVLGDDLDKPEWHHRAAREHEQDALDSAIGKITATRDGYALMSALQQAGVAAGVMQTSADLLENDPQLKHRHHWCYLDHPEMGSSLYNSLPFSFKTGPVGPRTHAPLLGEHTFEICSEKLGMDQDAIERCGEEGLFT